MNGGKKCLKALNQMDFMIWAWMKFLLELELHGEMLLGHSERFYFIFFPFLPYFQKFSFYMRGFVGPVRPQSYLDFAE